MNKAEFVYREILFQAMEQKNFELTQTGLAKMLQMSLTNVNHSLKQLRKMSAIRVMPRGFKIVNARKILYYWASARNLRKDIIYETRAERPVAEIEKAMPGDAVFAGYSAYKFRFGSVPADYSEVYVYASDLDEIKRRFPASKKTPNLFVMGKDAVMEKYGKTGSIANIFVDLWNLPEWYARDFLKELEEKIGEMPGGRW